MRILIVDDEEAIRKLVRKYAEFAGYEVAEAKDGMEAVLLCRKEEYDCVIMDIMMPELDGFSACREIRKTSSVPILLLSARGEEYDKIKAAIEGAEDSVVPFPVMDDELIVVGDANETQLNKHDFKMRFKVPV